MFNIVKLILLACMLVPTILVAACPSDTVPISWTAPTENTDGTSLTDLKSYTLVYGRAPERLTSTRSGINGSTTSWCIKKSSPKPFYVAVRAVNSKGIESVNSNIRKVL